MLSDIEYFRQSAGEFVHIVEQIICAGVQENTVGKRTRIHGNNQASSSVPRLHTDGCILNDHRIFCAYASLLKTKEIRFRIRFALGYILAGDHPLTAEQTAIFL